MSRKNGSTRQAVLAFECGFKVEDLGADNGYSFHVPRGTTLLSLLALGETAFNGSGTVTLTVTAIEPDATSTTLVNAVDIKTAGNETVANVPIYFPNGAEIRVVGADQASDSSAGLVNVTGTYTQRGAGTKEQVK